MDTGPLGFGPLGFGHWAIRVWAVRVRVWTLVTGPLGLRFGHFGLLGFGHSGPLRFGHVGLSGYGIAKFWYCQNKASCAFI